MTMKFILTLCTIAALVGGQASANTPLTGWQHTSLLPVLTTPDGANLPASAMVEQFPKMEGRQLIMVLAPTKKQVKH